MFTWEDATRQSQLACPAGNWRSELVAQAVDKVAAQAPGLLKRTPLGKSVEGRPIELLTLGSGSERILAWSQMHGDEPTHTTVLLNLLGFLAAEPEHPAAKAMLTGCTLGLVILLNPDGALRTSRFNAWGIDLNRDARRLVCPESRLLRDVVKSFAPQYGFNLHNQNHRTTVASQRTPASVALLVPPRDAENSDAPSVKRAAQVASTFLAHVSPHCDGRVSRYDADYMPTAFGEWVQTQGVATVLVEVGGAPKFDFAWLDRLHLFGMVNTWAAIGAGQTTAVDPAPYYALRRSGGTRLFDLFIHGARLYADGPPVDFGVNFPGFTAAGAARRQAVMEELGDLVSIGGIEEIQANGAVVTPGLTALAPELSPLNCNDATILEPLIDAGVTSVIGLVDLNHRGQVAALPKRSGSPMLNTGFAVIWPAMPDDRMDPREFALLVSRLGVLLIVTEDPRSVAGTPIEQLGLPIIAPTAGKLLDEYPIARLLTPELLALAGRGRIARGGVADLVLTAPSGERTVLIGGRRIDPSEPCGAWLTNRRVR
jgi:hypothetical protein